MNTSLPLVLDLRLRRTGSRLGEAASTASLIPHSLSLPRRTPPPLGYFAETSCAANVKRKL
jgi:hypothetical protein